MYTNVRVLDPYGDVILENGQGDIVNDGSYWFEAFVTFPKQGKKYIINADNANGLPVKFTLTCTMANTTSRFR
jgi:hypothetical protein